MAALFFTLGVCVPNFSKRRLPAAFVYSPLFVFRDWGLPFADVNFDENARNTKFLYLKFLFLRSVSDLKTRSPFNSEKTIACFCLAFRWS